LIGEPSGVKHRRTGSHLQSGALKFRQLAVHFLHLFAG
jgi:hypothetical protein